MAVSGSPAYNDRVLPDGARSFRDSLPVTQVELHVSCRNLADMDVFSKSDPMVVMYTQAMGSNEWKEFGRTEHIMNNLNPDFVTTFVIHYFFEEMQKLRFEVYDIDKESPKLSDHDYIGAMECNLGSIVGEFGGRLQKPLVNPKIKKPGTIIVSAEEISDCKDVLTLQFNGKNLDKKDFFGKSDPFLEFYRCNEDNSFSLCHRTEVIKNTLNPTWKPFTIEARALCNGDYDRSMRVECYDWDRDGGHDLIGVFSTTINELKSTPGITYEVISPKKKEKKKGSYKNSGTVKLLLCKIEERPSFLDFIRGGTQINFTVAIDFTSSNGNPKDSTSLHYINLHEQKQNQKQIQNQNQYVKALTAVGEICQDYDTDKMFPAFGFGARVPPDWKISHEFPLNGNPQDPNCNGIHGVLAAYYHSIERVQLHGPTNFAPIINQVARIASSSHREKPGQESINRHGYHCHSSPLGEVRIPRRAAARAHFQLVINKGTGQFYLSFDTRYFVLLMITDGIISDMPQTKEAIVNAASLPVSIIIVGVGPAEFEAMEELDGDTVRLSSRGRYAERDIVQFVPFRDYIGQAGNVINGARLAKDVLEELPDQFLDYMRKQKIKPRPPKYTNVAKVATV